jgi:polysaccharide biosynthesis protein PelF
MALGKAADICLLLEGTYPYVPGGVSGWTHDLIRSQPRLTFHLVSLLARDEERKAKYEVPSNVVGIDHVFIQGLPGGPRSVPGLRKLVTALAEPLARLQSRQGGEADLARILHLLAPHRGKIGRHALLNSEAAWDGLLDLYEDHHADSSFLDFFWSWRALAGGLYAVALAPLPAARAYHSVSTGYAGLMAARARLETGRPALVTEHGIYTNERRIEIAMADWLFEGEDGGLNVNIWRRDLKDMWTDTFASYSRACYGASEQIITLYEGNQQFQIDDGASREKLRVIPNGIDVPRYAPLRAEGIAPRDGGKPPHIALIGRVVPIKDIKTFIRAMGLLRDDVPDLRASVIGPFEEDPEYDAECRALVAQMGLGGTVAFPGRQKLDDVIPDIDVQVLTSISEGMPLVILEAGAAGIPSVSTDVGACREMILGRSDEEPRLGPAGAVTPLSNPKATADACLALIEDPHHYRRCSAAIRARVKRYYDKADQDRVYRELYESVIAAPDVRSLASAAE